MRHSTAKKITHVEHTQETSAEIFDFAHLTRVQIATQAEQACHIPGNAEACDYEEFMAKYGMKLAGQFE